MVVETNNLTKIYEGKVGCKNVSISIREGEIFGFLGPNGAGKSTFIKMLVGLLFPTSGSAEILGKPLGDISVRKKIGYLPENFKYYEWMTGVDLLSFHASLYMLDNKLIPSKIDEMLELVNLKGSEKYKVGTYSKGMQQRIGMACALISNPDLIFFDEPTSALDPIGRKHVRDIMQALKSSGKTILLNSHLLSEVEMVCDSVAIINKGSIISQGKLEDILKANTKLQIRAENISTDIIRKLRNIDSDLISSNNQIIMNIDSSASIPDIASLIVQGGGKLYQLTSTHESLEDLFVNLIEGGKQH
ncbi:MAG: ABC transporter ATP-binding protein [Deltaproteobacteria bacterium]